MIKKIVSGGQTGADQAALDAAMAVNVAHGGWIPLGRKTEKGPLSEKYRLQEMPSGSYAKRTEKNVTVSDGTLILSHGPLTGGSELTQKLAEKHEKPCLHQDLMIINHTRAMDEIKNWIKRYKIKILNVAGPRASHAPGIYQDVKKVILALLNNKS